MDLVLRYRIRTIPEDDDLFIEIETESRIGVKICFLLKDKMINFVKKIFLIEHKLNF